MADLLTPGEVYAHLRLSGSPPDDEALVELYRQASFRYIANYLNTANYPKDFPVKAAALLLIGSMYERREAEIAGTIVADNPAVDRLLHPYRVGIGM